MQIHCKTALELPTIYRYCADVQASKEQPGFTQGLFIEKRENNLHCVTEGNGETPSDGDAV